MLPTLRLIGPAWRPSHAWPSHTGDYQLALMDLKRPLKDGDRFDLTLNFEHAGQQTMHMWVQTPHAAQVSHSEH